MGKDFDEIRVKANEYLSQEEHDIFRNEVKMLLESEDSVELSDRFWRELDFGTGGLRGIIGGGLNRINPTVIRKATLGLANYIRTQVPESKRCVVIAYDNRNYSQIFAEEAARVLASNRIRTWIFTSLRPTPVLSYAVRMQRACAGIMVTASHNPAIYNGYKVFWSDGAQVVPPHDKGIISEVRKVSGRVEAMSLAEAKNLGLVIPIDKEVDNSYRQMVAGQSLNPALVRERGRSIRVVYTPLHGAGLVPVESVLGEMGIELITVPEQREPDGDFPTTEFPNPEFAPALEMGLKLAHKEKADLLLATDPDADRLGIAVPQGSEWILITGNQLGAMLADYIFRTRKEAGTLPGKPAFVNTIVTSMLQNRIAESYSVNSFRVLTGFKYIGEKIRQFESEASHHFVFGSEESYGFLVGTAVRDKDAVSAAAMTAEMALWNQARGMTVMDHLKELWSRFGYWQEILISRNFEGEKGQDIMAKLMTSLRRDTVREIAAIGVSAVMDYRDGTTTSHGRKEKNIFLPTTDALQYGMEDGSLITVRPSGTEPKIKFYASCRSDKGDDPESAQAELARVFEGIEKWASHRIKLVSH